VEGEHEEGFVGRGRGNFNTNNTPHTPVMDSNTSTRQVNPNPELRRDEADRQAMPTSSTLPRHSSPREAASTTVEAGDIRDDPSNDADGGVRLPKNTK